MSTEGLVGLVIISSLVAIISIIALIAYGTDDAGLFLALLIVTLPVIIYGVIKLWT